MDHAERGEGMFYLEGEEGVILYVLLYNVKVEPSVHVYRLLQGRFHSYLQSLFWWSAVWFAMLILWP